MFFPIAQSQNIVTNPNLSSRPFVCGFEQIITGNTTFTLAPGCARGASVPGVIQYPSGQPDLPGNITVDVSVLADVNVNGVFPVALDQAGMAGNDTVFQVIALGDSTGKNQTIAIVATGANFIPKDANGNNAYDLFARVGLVYIDGSSFQIIPTSQNGHYEVREYTLGTSVNVLNGGDSTLAAVVDLTDGDGPIAPWIISRVTFNATFTADSQSDLASLGPDALSGQSIVLQSGGTAKECKQVVVSPSVNASTGNAAIKYSVTSGDDSLTLDITGFTDDMAVQINNFPV